MLNGSVSAVRQRLFAARQAAYRSRFVHRQLWNLSKAVVAEETAAQIPAAVPVIFPGQAEPAALYRWTTFAMSAAPERAHARSFLRRRKAVSRLSHLRRLASPTRQTLRSAARPARKSSTAASASSSLRTSERAS